MLPEATPVHEAAALPADLCRAQIEPFAWVITLRVLVIVVYEYRKGRHALT